MRTFATIITLAATPGAVLAQGSPMSVCIPELADAENVGDITAALEAARTDPEVLDCLSAAAALGQAVQQRQGEDERRAAQDRAEAERRAAEERAEAERAINP